MDKVQIGIVALAALLCLVAPPIAWLYKPRSPEEYIALGPRKAAAIKFVNAAFPQLPTMVDAAKQFVLGAARTVVEEQVRKFPGQYLPPTVQDSIPTVRDLNRSSDEAGHVSVDLLRTIAVGGVIGACAAYVLACTPPKDASDQRRATARGTVLVVAEAIHIADATCASTAKATRDLALAETCAQAYDDARAGLVAAAASVDAWDDGSHGGVVCGVQRGLDGLGKLLPALRKAGAKIPTIVDDATRLGAILIASEGTCK